MSASAVRFRRVVTLVAAVLLGALSAATPANALQPTAAASAAATALVAPNRITAENRVQGNSSWRIPWSGKTLADDKNLAVKGYASATSVKAGGAIGLHIRSQGSFTYNVYRLGYYQGLGGRHMAGGSGAAANQSACATAASGMVACGWSRTVSLQTTASWTSGVYVVVLTTGNYQNYITFVVRDDRPDAILSLSPTNTYQAYNNFPDNGTTGKSMYGYNSYGATTVGGTKAAVTVSYDRPYARTGVSDVLRDEAPYIQWAEARGYDMTYATDVDLHANAALASNARAMWVPGHSEYWSDTMFEAARASRDAGVDQSYLGANNLFWRVRLEPNSATVANRQMTCWKDKPQSDPVQDPALRTDLFRRVGKPEQLILGQMYSSPAGLTQGLHPWVVSAANHWFYRGTGMGNGSKIANIVGGETDFRHSNVAFPDSLETAVVSQSRTLDRYGGEGLGEGVLYKAPSGAWMFDAGTLFYTWGLGTPGTVDPRAQTMTTNLMARQSGFASSAAVERIGGADRYATAALISARTFEPGVPTVYLTTGRDFPDALSASAATRGSSPVLLVEPGSMPSAVREELARLAPQSVRVLGGPSTVSDFVLRDAEEITGAPVTRIAGSDRFVTSSLISRASFAPGVPVVYVSTGLDFPDALAAGAAGAQAGGPVLLTRASVLSPQVLTEIQRLRPARIVVTGGATVVSDSVVTTLRQIAPTIRLAGPNRFETSRVIARDLQSAGVAATVAVTTGLNFPDALAGGPMVAHAGGAVVLVRETLDPGAAEEILRNDPSQLYLLGAHPTVPNAVETSARRLFDVVNGTPNPVVVDPTPPMRPRSTTLDRTTEEPILEQEYDRLQQTLEELPWLSPAE